MKGSLRHRIAGRPGAHAAGLAILPLALLLLVATARPAPAAAATVSGTVRNGQGLRVLVVQANGTTRTKVIGSSTGAFSISGVNLRGASLQLVRSDGSYYGPVVLKRTSAKAFTFIKGSLSLKLGAIALKGGFAVAERPRTGRYQTLAAYTAKAVSGRPIGARKLGLVKTVTPAGYRGAGGDLDLDGIVNAFDIDDNGNRVIDNIDRTRRGDSRPSAPVAARAAAARTQEPATEFRMFSNFKLRGDTAINADIPGIADVDSLIDAWVPVTVCLATEVLGAGSGTLDGLGNTYLVQHEVNSQVFPIVNDTDATYTDAILNVFNGDTGDAQIRPGALPSEIGSGDCFVETIADGTKYPGTLNFVFNTAPALKSYQWDTQDAATEIAYNDDGTVAAGSTFTKPAGASQLTLTFWRPQRRATPAEAAAGSTWIDMGGLMYIIQIIGPTTVDNPAPGNAPQDSYSNASANGIPITLTPDNEGVLDPTADVPASSGNTVTFTIDFTKCYSEADWASFTTGDVIDIDLMAQSKYGDNASYGLRFEMQ